MTGAMIAFLTVFTVQVALTALSTVLTVLALRRGASAPNTCVPPISFIIIIAKLPEAEAVNAMAALDLAQDAHEVIFAAEAPNGLSARIERDIQQRETLVRIVYRPGPYSTNPKADMMDAGMAAATHDVLAFVDGNLDIPSDLADRIAAAIKTDPFLVSTAPLARGGDDLWRGVEEALITRTYGRWCMAGNVLGIPTAIGKLLVFRKSWLMDNGGSGRLLDARAEDTALARLARNSGVRVSAVRPPLTTPLIGRDRHVIIERMARWMQIRRHDVPLVFLSEALVSLAGLLAIGGLLAALSGIHVSLALAMIVLVWHFMEAAIATVSPDGWRPEIHLHSAIRDILFPIYWTRAWLVRRYRWRDHD